MDVFVIGFERQLSREYGTANQTRPKYNRLNNRESERVINQTELTADYE